VGWSHVFRRATRSLVEAASSGAMGSDADVAVEVGATGAGEAAGGVMDSTSWAMMRCSAFRRAEGSLGEAGLGGMAATA
jgi:hypothetical protein